MAKYRLMEGKKHWVRIGDEVKQAPEGYEVDLPRAAYDQLRDRFEPVVAEDRKSRKGAPQEPGE